MLKLFGVAHLHPTKILRYLAPALRGIGTSLSVVQPPHIPKSKFMLFVNADDLMNMVSLLRNVECIGIVFDYRLRLEELSPITIIDLEDAGYHKAINCILDNLESKEHIRLVSKRTDHIKALLDTKNNSGFLHSYNTLIYNISNKEVREQIRASILSRMSGLITKEAFDKVTQRLLPVRGKSRDSVIALATLVNGQEAEKLRVALVEARANPPQLEKIAEKRKVELYDLRYFLATIAKAKANGKAVTQKTPPAKAKTIRATGTSNGKKVR
jgi:hypothetical protein